MTFLLVFLVAAFVVTAGIFDILYRRIPNWLVLSGLVVGLASHFVPGVHSAGLGLKESAIGFGLGFLINFPLYLLGARGAGDVKMMAALGALLGWEGWLFVFILSSILGGLFAIALVVSKGRLKKTVWNVGYILGRMSRLQRAGGDELDMQSGKALTIPSGAVTALGCLPYLGIVTVRLLG